MEFSTIKENQDYQSCLQIRKRQLLYHQRHQSWKIEKYWSVKKAEITFKLFWTKSQKKTSGLCWPLRRKISLQKERLVPKIGDVFVYFNLCDIHQNFYS